MRTSLRFFAALAALAAGGCGSSGDGTTQGDPVALEAYCGEGYADVERRIDRLLGSLTLGEKVEMMHGSSLGTREGLWMTPGNDELGVPGFAMTDGPRGVGARTGPSTAFPVAMARGASWDPELERRVGQTMGLETRAAGASVLLAPTVNVLRHPRWGRAQETYGEDTVHIGAMAVAFIEGAQEHVLASVKHFAANSIEDTRYEVSANMDERTLREVYLPHFRRAVRDAHVASVMSAYNRLNDTYCSENPHLLRDILKGEWGFQGFVESDWIFGVNSTVPAALAGLDLEMPAKNYFGDALVTAVEAGEVSEEVIDEAVRRLLRAQLCYRLDTDPPVVEPEKRETPEAIALARESAERSIVLLKNEGGVLPLDRGALTELVIVGPLADVENIGDTGSSDVAPSSVVTALEGLTAAAGTVGVTYVTGDPADGENAAAIAGADAVIAVVGLTSADEGEKITDDNGGDRESLELHADDVELLTAVAALNDSVVVVLEGGAAITMGGWLEDVEAVLMAWYPGMEGGAALASILFGDVNPSGRLPIVFPAAEGDLPPFDNASLEVEYGYYHGYRYLDENGAAPLFPFGYGLSYTGFAYANLALASSAITPDATLVATVDVTNTGERAGIETVQLYAHAATSRVDRAARELKAFAQVALEPGETKTVTLEVKADDLAFWDSEADAFEVEATEYVVEVGPNERDLPLMASFTVSSAP
jgi:beta-glucosidase